MNCSRIITKAFVVFFAACTWNALSSAKRPIAVVRWGDHIAVANRDSGSISLLDIEAQTVTNEFPTAERIDDMVGISNSWLAICDSANSELKLLSYSQDGFKAEQTIDLPVQPVRIEVSPSRDFLAVSLLWAHQVALFDLKNEHDSVSLSNQRVIDLAFAPRELQFLPDRRLLVADAFGSRLAVVNVEKSKISRTFKIPGHNIRGISLTVDDHEILITHQQANEFVPGTRNHVFWGNVVTNLLRRIPLHQIESLQTNESTLHGFLFPLADQNRGSGDPSAILVSESNKQIVALSGVNEIAVRVDRANSITRYKTGRRPIAVCETNRPETIVVANLFDDSLSIVDLEKEVIDTISLGHSDLSSSQQGEALFYDATLSLDGWISCNSCHPDGHTNGKLNDNLGDDDYGAPKRVISLLGTGDSAPWAWNGSQHNLVDQVRKSLYLTMHGAREAVVLEEDVMSITSYLRSLPHPPSISTARGTANPSQIAIGKNIFTKNGCSECHGGTAYTSREKFEISLSDDTKTYVLNPPSLRGVSQRVRWLHDGRAVSLRDVFARHGHQNANQLSEEELDSLLHFLNSL